MPTMKDTHDFSHYSRFRDKKKPTLPVTILLCIALSWTATAHQERIISAVQEGNCTYRVEADDEDHIVRLRVLPESSGCFFSKDMMQSLLNKTFLKSDLPKPEGVYLTLFIGRLVDYPWLSENVASAAYTDRQWNKQKGKPVSININKYMSSLLMRDSVRSQLEEPIRGCGYTITSVSVEKVLVGGFGDIPHYKGKLSPGKLPFDAMVWFRLEKK